MKRYFIPATIAIASLALAGCAGGTVQESPTATATQTPAPQITTSTGEVITLDDAGIIDLVKQRYAGCMTAFKPTSDLQYNRTGTDLLPGTIYWYNDRSPLVFDVAQGSDATVIYTVPDSFSTEQIAAAGC